MRPRWSSSSLSSRHDLRRFRAVVTYDGTEIAGFQWQPGRRTVQGLLQEGLLKLTGESTTVTGAGRTDAGVHAKGQVLHFDSRWFPDTAALRRAWNAVLPRDVAVLAVDEAPPGFHARFSALSRSYSYRLVLRAERDPLRRRYSLLVQKPLDLDRMQAAAACMVGSHDFAGFGRPMRPGGSTIRQVMACRFDADGDEWILSLTANAFLRHQVRRMVGALIDLGRGQASLEDLDQALRGLPSRLRPRRVPPQGLVLMTVDYPNDEVIAAASGRVPTGDDDDDEDLYAEGG